MIEIFVVTVKRSPKAEKRVAECIEKEVCICGCAKKLDKHTKRHLHSNCYYRYRADLAALANARERAKYEADLKRRGELLDPQEIRALKRQSAFSRAAKRAAS